MAVRRGCGFGVRRRRMGLVRIRHIAAAAAVVVAGRRVAGSCYMRVVAALRLRSAARIRRRRGLDERSRHCMFVLVVDAREGSGSLMKIWRGDLEEGDRT